MKISCPACAAKYSIADEKVQDKLAKIRCRKCGTTIVIDGKVSPANVYAGDSGASSADAAQAADHTVAAGGGEYSVDFGDNDQRNMTIADLVAAYNSGQVTADTYVWADGMADWTPLGQVPPIVEALHAASNPAHSQASAQQDVAAASPAWSSTESPSAVRAAAKAGGGRGSTADLFGSFETAGGEGDVTTSAREPERAAAPAPSPAAAATVGAAGTGARNESSVLFSLSALTSAAKPASLSASASLGSSSSTGPGPTATKEDSGLIDLKALTAAADAPAAMPLTPAPLGMSPPLGLGLAPPLGGGVEAQIMAPMTPPPRSKTGIFIGAGIAVAAVAIAVAIIVTRQPPPPAPTAAATQAPPAPTPTPTAEESTTAKPPATGTADEDKDKAKVAAKKYTGTGRAPPAKGDKQPPSSGDKPPGGEKKPPPKSASPCGCAAGDLQCAMKCAAKGG